MHEPRNWRNVANVTELDIICHGEGMHCGHIDKCNTCKMSEFNPERDLYIQSCKDRLAKEQTDGKEVDTSSRNT